MTFPKDLGVGGLEACKQSKKEGETIHSKDLPDPERRTTIPGEVD